MWTLHRKRRVETMNTNDDAKSERRGAALSKHISWFQPGLQRSAWNFSLDCRSFRRTAVSLARLLASLAVSFLFVGLLLGPFNKNISWFQSGLQRST